MKELKEKFLRSKTVPVLSKVDDINAITGLLKDFLRNLKEPLLTFRLNRPFMDAAGMRVCVTGVKTFKNKEMLVFLVAVSDVEGSIEKGNGTLNKSHLWYNLK